MLFNLSNTPLTARYDFDAEATGSDASLYQWYWRKTGSTDWHPAQKAGSKSKQFTPDASYAGYDVRFGVMPKGSQRDVKGVQVYSNSITIIEPVTWHIAEVRHYYFFDFVAPLV